MRRRIWRRHGGAVFELEGSDSLLERARLRLGDSGWSEEGAPLETLRVEIDATDAGVRCRSVALGLDVDAEEDQALSDLEHACVDRAVRSDASPAALHAASLESERGLLLLVGPHGSGKTTLALALLERGLTLLGDDLVLVSTTGEVGALSRPLRVRPGTPPLLPRLGARILSSSHHDAYNGLRWLDLARIGGAVREPMFVADVVVALHGNGGEGRVEPMGSAETLSALLPHVFTERAAEPACVAAVAAMLEGARCHCFEHALDPIEAADVLTDALGLRA